MSQHGLRFAIESSIREAMTRHHEYVTVEHLLYALLFEKVASDVLQACGGDTEALQVELEEFFDENVPKLSKDAEEDLVGSHHARRSNASR
jgi:ATP-dependent Clp protease ATP-binding subunit ClpA